MRTVSRPSRPSSFIARKPRPPLPTHIARDLFPVKILISDSCAIYEPTTSLHNYHILVSSAHRAISTNHSTSQIPKAVLFKAAPAYEIPAGFQSRPVVIMGQTLSEPVIDKV